MISIQGLIVALFTVIAIVNNSPSIPKADKERVILQIIAAVGDANQATAPKTGSVSLERGGLTSIPATEYPSRGEPASLIVGAENADGSRSMTASMNGAASASYEVREFSQVGKSAPIAKGTVSAYGQKVVDLYDKARYSWSLVSYDAAGRTMATTTGEFIIGDN